MDKPIGSIPGALEQYQLRDKTVPEDQGKIGQAAFFELMVTQLQNQDPMKPMESGDFLGQIAQFSTVSGIDELQGSFATLASSLQSSQALQASTMVGREVVMPADAVVRDVNETVRLAAELPSAASSVRVTISDAAGQIVNQVALGGHAAGRVRFNWDGLDGSGQPSPAGTYGLRFDALINGQEQALQPEVAARVDSVSLARDGSAPTLNVAGFGTVAMSDVVEIL